jgi:anti-sigma regulatory factor (Ser/Thr protein kinase)
VKIMGDLLGSIDLLGHAGSVQIARAYVRTVLYEAGRRRDLDDIETLVSEIFTNAIRHSESGRRPGGVVKVRVYDGGKTVRVEVTDEGPPISVPAIPEQIGPFCENGRGLWMVRELSSSWGWEQQDHGNTVWFEVRS